MSDAQPRPSNWAAMSASNYPGAGLGLDCLTGAGHPVTIGDTDVVEKPTPVTRNRHRHLDADSDDFQPADISTVIMLYNSSNLSTLLNESETINQPAALSRHGTLLSINATPARNAVELKSVLGNSRSRLKPGAALLPPQGRSCGVVGTSLEQAKSRARVEVDIILDSKTCVQGGYLQGNVTVRVQKCTNNEAPVFISSGKVRVIGFESMSNNLDRYPLRYPFYQCSSSLSTVAATSGGLYELQHDAEGFARAIEGEHRLPFSMYLPMSADHGVPKGALQDHSGVAVRYIAMVSIKIKDPVSDNRSIAHFYRNCEIWPRHNPSVILAPAKRPLQATTRKSLFMGGSGYVDLTPSVHRLHWIAGQHCFVKVKIVNGSRKTISGLTLALIRSTIVFKPDRRLDALDDVHNMDPDACQTSTTQKQVAESVLELGQRALRGHAGTKGWWPGVAPGEHREFSHSILLPPDALSVTRSRILEIDYFIRVTLSAGALRTADVQASLPIRIVNFLSIDPPPSYSLPGSSSLDHSMPHLGVSVDAPLERLCMRPQEIFRPRVGISGSYDRNSRALESLAKADEERLPSPGHSFQSAGSLDESLLPEDAYEGIDEFNDESPPDTGRSELYINQNEDLGDLTMYEDDADEFVPHIIHIDPEYANAPRFADLYHASFQDGLCQLACSGVEENEPQQTTTFPTKYHAPPGENGLEEPILRKNPSGREYHSVLHPNARPPVTWSRPGRPQGPSSFAQRVHIKMEASAATSNLPLTSDDVSLTLGETSIHGQVNSAPSTEQTGVPIEGDDMCHYMQDSPTQRSTNFSGHLQFQNHDYDATTVIYFQKTASVGLGEGPDYHTESHFVPNSESITSLSYRKTTDLGGGTFGGGGEGGSRLLPKPPSITNMSHTTAFTALSTAPVTLPVAALPPFAALNDDYTSRQSSSEPADGELSQKDDNFHEAVSGVDLRVKDVGTRPSILALKKHTGSSMGGSSNSVKERIRELEERQRLLELQNFD